MNELAAIRTEPGAIQHVIQGGPIILGALGVLIISGLLFLLWLFLAVRRRRLFPLLGVATVGLAALAYLVYDWQHISLNLSMRGAQAVRQDCIRLLQQRRSSLPDEGRELHLHGSEIPESFARLGAKFVRVTHANVQISLIRESPLTGGAWGFLYDPDRAYLTDGWPDDIRSTWYRDFYEFRVHGE